MKFKVAYQVGDKVFFDHFEAVQQVYRYTGNENRPVKAILLAIEEKNFVHSSKYFIVGEMTEISYDKIKF